MEDLTEEWEHYSEVRLFTLGFQKKCTARKNGKKQDFASG